MRFRLRGPGNSKTNTLARKMVANSKKFARRRGTSTRIPILRGVKI